MSGSIILKMAVTDFFNWIVDNGFFGRVEISALVHDECNIVYPKELHDIAPNVLKEYMEKAASKVCTKLPIPAEASIAPFWVH